VLRLHTFGSTFVVGEMGEPLTGAATQRRTLALFAVLAVSGNRGTSRDKLLGLLWPEADAERARHSLTQALYSARRALQIEDLFLTGSELRLNPERLTSDVRELDEALEAGELERAVGLYEGPFLDGFFLSGSPEFEQWIAAQRQRLHAGVTDALDRLAVRAEESGEHRRALEWRRRLAALEPLDSGSAVKLMTAMAAVGDRAGALHHARVHATLLRDQLDLDPDPVVEALATRLRETNEWSTVVRTPVESEADTLPTPPPALSNSTDPMTVSEPVRESTALSGEVAEWTPVRREPPRWWRWAALSLVLVVLIGIGVLVGRGSRTSIEPIHELAARQRVVVAPFRVSGADASLAYLREGMVELLSTRLADDSAARSVDAGAVLGAWRAAGLTAAASVARDTVVKLAARLGAERVVVGSVVGSRQRAVLSATVLHVPQGTVSAQATVSGPADSITTLIDRLAAQLLVSEAGQDESLAHYTSHSLPALQAFLAGQAAFRQHDYTDALQQYERALRRDSSFALAALYKALTSDRLNLESSLRSGVRVAWTSRESLNDRNQALLLALVGPRYPALPTSAEQTAAWQRIVDLAPGNADTWYALSVRLLKDGAAAGLQDPRAQALAALRRALTVSPAHAPARALLAQLDSVRPGFTGTAADTAALRSTRASLSRMSTADLRAFATASQFDTVGLADGARALAILQSRGGTDAIRADLALAEHSLALNQGRIDAALEATSRLRRLQPGSDAWQRLRVLDALYAGGDSAAAEGAVRALAQLTRATPLNVPTSWDGWLANACVVAQWHLARRDTTAVRSIIEVLRARRTINPATPVGASPEACAELLDAQLAVATQRRDARSRVRHLDSLVFTPQVAGDASTYAPLLVARLHEHLGDPAAALRAIRRRPYLSGWPRYLAAMRREEERLRQLAPTP